MSQDKEFEIQMQFLEEAADYLNTLEGVLLEIDASNRITPEKINAALRAAHSIKGGAGMMGFRYLSDLAHRLEDSFKVLKTRKNSVEIDTELQSLLLSGVDWLRQIVDLLKECNVIDEQWLATFCYPIFEELHERLGEPSPEDFTTMLLPEEGQDIVPLLFETEVEGCLQHLESVLASSQPNLQEEVATMAVELGGLGEMLQLSAFTELCQSITTAMLSAPAWQVEEIARAAIEAWRRSQALVMSKQLESLPNSIDIELVEVGTTYQQDENYVISRIIENDFILNEKTPEQEQSHEIIAADFEALEAAFAEELPQDINLPTAATIVSREFRQTDYKFAEQKAEPSVAGNKNESQENTVRVPSKQLEQINDLFGEVIVQRNGLNLQLERLRKLARNLNQRVQILERENRQLRTAYDKIATHGVGSYSAPSLEFAGDDGNPTQFVENRFDSLEMDSYNELNSLSQEVMETIVQVQEVTTDLQLSLDDTDQIARKLNKTSKQLQRKLTRVRMRPLSDLVDRFPRALRDMSVEYGKNVQLKVEGAGTLIERSILEALNEPLMHLLRNAFDHGIEDATTRRDQGKPDQGLIEIKATHQGNRTIITVRDDGRGISLDGIRTKALAMGLESTLLAQATDEEVLSLIFEPGFSTTEQVTTLSGRGIGMDVVRSKLKLVRGDVKVDTTSGVGTTFTLSVPFTLSVTRVLLVESNRMLLAFPTDVVSEISLLQNELIVSIAGSNEVLNWKGSTLPLVRLERYLEFNCPRYDNPTLETPPAINSQSVLFINQGHQSVAVQVDRCWGEQEVAIRHVEGNIPLPAGFSNSTILGDGRVVALVNVNELLYWIASHDLTPRINQLPTTRLKSVFVTPNNEKPAISLTNQRGTILIVDDSINVRRFLALTLEKGGFQVEQAKDGQDALEKLQSGLKVQAVICDIEMPRIDGYGFLGRVKSNDDFRNIPVAMLTSRSSDKHRQLAMQLGARAYFSKPYNEQELLKTMETIIFPLAGASKN
ncbi:MAG: hybrid sensor histidine kinase/response regulator [Rhizonema sp. NSF051]|nr:hybrid sensor histidine kinase/response regulator [Rhizonema sp. NSF051]